mmetsp:Transcript_38143/g.127683  ORF Transcript_38143/g.127683 Transcript_38143/m.127683 type:complete len:226 (+) Transcript_38143:23-700(+)
MSRKCHRLGDAARPEAKGAGGVAVAVLGVGDQAAHGEHARPLRLGRVEAVVLGQPDRRARDPRHQPRLRVSEVCDRELAAHKVEGDDRDGGARRGEALDLPVHPLARRLGRLEQGLRARVVRRLLDPVIEEVVATVLRGLAASVPVGDQDDDNVLLAHHHLPRIALRGVHRVDGCLHVLRRSVQPPRGKPVLTLQLALFRPQLARPRSLDDGRPAVVARWQPRRG